MAELTFKELLVLLRKKWWFISLITCLALIVSGYLNFFHFTPIYTNSSTLLVNDRDQQQQNNISFDDVMLYEKLIGTYKDIIVSKRILGTVSEKFNLSYDQLYKMINVSSRANSQVITLSVTSPDYHEATEIVNYIAETFRKNLPEIMTVDNVQILDSADYKPNPSPIKPNKTLNMAIAFFLGFFTSSTLVVLMYFIDSRLRTEEEIGSLLQFPILGSIPRYDKRSRMSSNYLGR